MIKNYKFILILLFVSCFLSHAMENDLLTSAIESKDFYLDYDTENPEVVEMKGFLLKKHCHCVNNSHAPKINKHDDCTKTLELILKCCTILDYYYRPSKNNNNDKRPLLSIRKIINDKKRGGKPCTCFNNDERNLLHLALNNKAKKTRKKLPKFNTVQDIENRKRIESSKELQIRELLCNCKNEENYSHSALIQILSHINDTKNKKLQNLLEIKKIIILQHCNCFIEKGFFSITKLPFKINVSNLKGKAILRKLLKYMKLNVLSTPDLINFLGLGPNVILPNTFSILHYDKRFGLTHYDKKFTLKRYQYDKYLDEKDKIKKELKQTSILGHAMRIIYKKGLIELYNVHVNSPFFLDWQTSYNKLRHWCTYADKKNKEVVNIINKDHLVILEKLYDMSLFDENFEFYRKQHSKGRSWLQTKIECFDPKDTLPEIITGINTKLYPELCFDCLGKISACNMTGYERQSRDFLMTGRNTTQQEKNELHPFPAVLKKLGADFRTIIERIMDPYNLKKQPNTLPPFDKAKFIKQFSQKS